MRTNLPSNTRPKITAKNTWFRRSKVGQIAMSRAGASIQPALSKATDNVLEPAETSNIAGPRRSRIAKVNNSVHSGAFEMLREITDELQVSNSTPFAGTGAQSTQHLNKTVPHVYHHRKTHVCEQEVTRHSCTGDVGHHVQRTTQQTNCHGSLACWSSTRELSPKSGSRNSTNSARQGKNS